MTPTKQRATRQGEAVREALRSAGGFRSAQDVYAVLRADGATVGLSTVYRHLQAFVDAGHVDVIHTPDGEATYRYCGDPGEGHHHHLVCRRCGRTEEIEGRAIERWAGEVATSHGYTEVDHTVELFGVCPPCGGHRDS
ncbi:MAG TPA: Fur family transcriptional regulator [Jatrophihabitans sp.]|nr:Fur family transcriptional regulator [Jatrophihabitans sp.]